MMNRLSCGWVFQAVVVTFTLMLSGCGIVDYIVGNNANINGAQPLLNSENAPPYNNNAIGLLAGKENEFAQVDLVSVLTDGNVPSECKTKLTDANECLAKALNAFYYKDPTTGTFKAPETLVENRNRVQERLVAASNSACRQFTQHLNSYQSYTNLFLGSLATGAGAAGAIVTNVGAARALAGAAGGLTGIRSEFNWDIFYHNAAAVITSGITEARYNYLRQLRGGNVADMTVSSKPGQGSNSQSGQSGTNPPRGLQALSITEYPVEAAIADALYYNDLCSLDKGLEKINQTLTLADHPGLDALADAQQKFNDLLAKQIDTAKLQKQKEAAAEGTLDTFTVSPSKLSPFGPGVAGTATSPVSVTVKNNTKATLSLAVNKVADPSTVFTVTPEERVLGLPKG